ncbi:unnamed protein product [Strongylus vulgaris]|uniref:TIL domain-containing protein n=1 Tax=Strongylus vulgaris TaxID=40348 RepID=A0A3P7L4Z4_STRVU|nr:unnamed protein product [Strongylus vulgaris]
MFFPVCIFFSVLLFHNFLPECSANETLNNCGNLCEGKCANLGKGPVPCPLICGPPACSCKNGFHRNAMGVCVTARDCPLVCGVNEEIGPCGNLCEPGCENAFGEVEIHERASLGDKKQKFSNPKVCIEICNPPACICKSNFYRKDGKCVPKSECPQPKKVNGNKYGDELIALSLLSIYRASLVNNRVPAASIGKASTNTKTNPDSFVNQPQLKCSANETLILCGNLCEGKCENFGKGPVPCLAICESPACACKDGFFRNKEGKCVPGMDCPSNCRQNEVINPCGSHCEPTCENAFGKHRFLTCLLRISNSNPRQKYALAYAIHLLAYANLIIIAKTENVFHNRIAPKVCDKVCRPAACVCKPSYYRNSNGICVPQSGCGVHGGPTSTSPKAVSSGSMSGGAQTSKLSDQKKEKPLKCGKDEVFGACGSLCEPTCENAFGKAKICPRICNPPACICKPHYYRKDGKCVPQSDCVQSDKVDPRMRNTQGKTIIDIMAIFFK